MEAISYRPHAVAEALRYWLETTDADRRDMHANSRVAISQQYETFANNVNEIVWHYFAKVKPVTSLHAIPLNEFHAMFRRAMNTREPQKQTVWERDINDRLEAGQTSFDLRVLG